MPLQEIHGWSGAVWRLGDRVEYPPLGEGVIESFVSAGLVYVRFDAATVGVKLVHEKGLATVLQSEPERED